MVESVRVQISRCTILCDWLERCVHSPIDKPLAAFPLQYQQFRRGTNFCQRTPHTNASPWFREMVRKICMCTFHWDALEIAFDARYRKPFENESKRGRIKLHATTVTRFLLVFIVRACIPELRRILVVLRHVQSWRSKIRCSSFFLPISFAKKLSSRCDGRIHRGNENMTDMKWKYDAIP